jgi:DNA-binding SARP family transcriptional activator
MSRLKVLLLGPPRVELDGAIVRFDTRKATALLAYLASSREGHRRDALAALLWPEYDNESARGALRRTLSTLKKGVGGDSLVVDRATVGLDGATWTDIAEFDRRLQECDCHGHPPAQVCRSCEVPLSKAVALYRGEFMAGFSLRDAAGFEDWQLVQSERSRRLASTALERLVRCLAAQRDFGRAIENASRWLALDPLHEPAHRRLMQLYAWNDQRAAAIKQYRDCVAILDRELGVPPLDVTSDLYQAVVENRPPELAAEIDEAGRVDRRTVASRPLQYPLTGRTQEWNALLDAYERVGPHGHVVVVEGEAGIGKSRLCNDFIEQAGAKGALVSYTRCHEGETELTYGPIIDLLRGVLGSGRDEAWWRDMPEQVVAEVARLLPELHQDGRIVQAPALGGPGARTRFYEALMQFLAEGAGGPPYGLLWVDDAQWADEASSDFLAFLATRLVDRPLCLILSWRNDQLAPAHRLAHVALELQRANAVTLIAPARLAESEVAELVARSRSQDGLEDLPARLYHETEGLPFFVVEYLDALNRDGASATGAWEPSAGARALIRARLSEVDQAGRQLLASAAVIGNHFDFDTLARASGRSEEETIAGLEELLRLSILKQVDEDGSAGPSYDFSHSLIRQFVYGETSAPRRRLLHGRVAEALGRTKRNAEQMARVIAGHYELGGRDQEAAASYELAGDHARSVFAYGEALGHFAAALGLGHPERARLHEAIGDLHTLLGEYRLALTSYETAAALTGPDGLIDLEHKLGLVHDRRGDWDAAESHFEAALGALPDKGLDPRAPGILADRSLTLHHRGHSERASDMAQRSLELAQAAGNDRSLAQAHNILGILSARRGDPQSGRRHLEESLRLARLADDPRAEVAASNNLALALGAGGNHDLAIDVARSALELAGKQKDKHREAAVSNNLADLLHAAGHEHESRDRLREAVRLFAEIGAGAGDDFEPEIWKLVEW